ncbi:ATP-binding protein [Streptomyces sp. NPDC090022]|uniref:ATP-binding protein n=1 Tax=Streptomyces sp. NPDC090022 TaxID=3365920 RepID=UPI003826DBD5
MSSLTVCGTPPTSPTPPSPYTLSYSLTLPGQPYSAGVARDAVRTVLRTHHLTPLIPLTQQVTAELMAAGWHHSPGEDLYLSLRYRDDSLRVIVYDSHTPHTQPRLAALCEARRRSHLRVLAALVKDCRGDWGFGPAREPGGGTRSWARLPTSPTSPASPQAAGRPERVAI